MVILGHTVLFHLLFIKQVRNLALTEKANYIHTEIRHFFSQFHILCPHKPLFKHKATARARRDLNQNRFPIKRLCYDLDNIIYLQWVTSLYIRLMYTYVHITVKYLGPYKLLLKPPKSICILSK